MTLPLTTPPPSREKTLAERLSLSAAQAKACESAQDQPPKSRPTWDAPLHWLRRD